jgi:hypothetical protein
MVNFYKDMAARGCLNRYEKNLLKQGVLFKPIKLAVFGMRPDELQEKELFIKNGHGLPGRPSSGASLRSVKSASSMGRGPPRRPNDDMQAGRSG